MINLRILKAVYYVPEIGLEKGTNVTDELSAQIMGDRLIYNGEYNRIFPDNFYGKVKRLRIEVKYRKQRFTKIYNENEKINLPHDLGEISKEKEVNTSTFNISGDYVDRDKNINSSISNWLSKYWWGFLIPIAVGVITYTFNEGRLPQLFNDIDFLSTNSKNITPATTTPNISDLFNKALSYDTVAERQDFLGKYVGSPIYGDGIIKEISRSGEKFLLDITVSGQPLICPQEKTDNLEKQFYFLKGKDVRLYGIFTYSTYFGSSGLVIDNCSIEIK